jgi:phosphodiesterase/alkaline phosphatase D-like protein
VYYASGTIASNVWDTGAANQPWTYLNWQGTLPSGTGITFEARASDSSFGASDASPDWKSVGGTSPITTGLPPGRYMQWRATLSTSNTFYTPVLHSVSAASSVMPVVATNAATFVSNNGAAANGTLLSLGQRSRTAYVHFQWGTTPTPDPSWQTTAALAFTAPGTYSEGLIPLSPGTTYYYRARAWDLDISDPVYGEIVSFVTSPVSPSVTTNAAGSITSGSAILNGYLSAKGSAAADNVSFQWGTTQGGPYPNSTTPEAMGSIGGFQAGIAGLGPNTTYYYRAKADGGINGAGYGAEMNFTTSRAPPSVTTGDATSVTSSSATLNGSLASMGAATTVSVSFRYGTTRGGPYPNSTSLQAKNTSGPFTAGLTGLTANTTYYFVASGDGGVNGTGYGSEMSFTTSKVPPSVTTAGAHNITAGSATLNGQIVSLGTATTVNTSFLWGTQQENLNTETPYQVLTVPVGFQANLTGLAANTTYYYRAKADGGVHGIGYGATMSFTTGKVPPSVTTNGATTVTDSTATLNGTLHSMGSAPMVEVSFQYGITSGMYSTQTAAQPLSAPDDFCAPLTGLAAGTPYYYRAKADGGIHGIAYGTEHMFTTGRTPPTVTTDNATYVTTNSATLNGNLTDRGTATTDNVSFQYGTTQGGPYPNLTPVQPVTATGAFHAGLTGLSPHTTYYYRAKADGGINGSSYGDEMSFRTSMFPPYVETLPATGTGSVGAATLNGNLYNLGSATTDNVSFKYGNTRGGPYLSSTTPQATTATGTFHFDLTSLPGNTAYYYRAKADGVYGTGYGDEMSFTTGKIPPSVTTNPADGITANLATLNGNLYNLGSATTDNVSFQYGNTHGGPYFSSTIPQATGATGTFHFDLTGLPGDTTYYYRAKADGGVNGTGYGAEDNFTTSMISPSVTTDNATVVAATYATMNGFLDSVGTSPTDNVSFVWGTTSNPSTPTENQTMALQGYFHANLSGLAPLTTYYFKARADGGAHGSDFGGLCSFTTGATPPSVSTGGATSITSISATLNGDLHSLGTATSDNVSFQWGASPGVYSNQTTPRVKNAPGDFFDSIAGLRNNTTYYYRAVASGGRHGTSFGAEHAFTTSADPPEVTTNAATRWTTDTAFLNGTLTVRGTATTDRVSFVYGTAPKGPYPNSTSPRSMTEAGPFQAGITGLTPFTTYYFKARADGGIYGTSYGAEDNFTTNHLPPVIWTGGANDIMTDAATLNGNLYLMGSATTVNVSFEYGTTSGAYTGSTTPQAMTEREAFQADLTGLLSNTMYYYRARGVGDNGSGHGAEQVFTTGSFPPAVTTDSATGIAASSATLNGNLDSRGTATTVNVSYEYGTTHRGPYPNSTMPQARMATGAFNANLSGLTSFTVYYYRARADGGIYSISHGEEMSFITPLAPPSVTTGDAASVTPNSAVLNGELTSPGRATTVNVSFLWGITRGGPYPNPTPPYSLNGPAAYLSNLGGLSPGTAYYFIAEADGGVYGVSYGVEKSFTTISPPSPPPTPAPPPHSSGQTSAVAPSTPMPLPNVVVQSASLSAASVAPGDPVKVTATVSNRGTVNGSTRLTLYVNGQEDSSQGVTVESGGNRPVYFTVTRSQPGSYSVYIGGVQAGSFVVAEYIAPGAVLLISLLLILASLVVGLIYVWRRRQQEY